MISERRNQLLSILYMVTKGEEKDKKRNLDILLDSIERDIYNQLTDIDYKKQRLQDDLDTLEYVRKEIYEK